MHRPIPLNTFFTAHVRWTVKWYKRVLYHPVSSTKFVYRSYLFQKMTEKEISTAEFAEELVLFPKLKIDHIIYNKQDTLSSQRSFNSVFGRNKFKK